MSVLTLRITNSSTSPAVGGASGLVVSNKANTTVENLKEFFAGLFKGAPSLTSPGLVPNTVYLRCDVSPVTATGTYTISGGSGVLTATINAVSTRFTY